MRGPDRIDSFAAVWCGTDASILWLRLVRYRILPQLCKQFKLTPALFQGHFKCLIGLLEAGMSVNFSGRKKIDVRCTDICCSLHMAVVCALVSDLRLIY